jgi:hypothetical protein
MRQATNGEFVVIRDARRSSNCRDYDPVNGVWQRQDRPWQSKSLTNKTANGSSRYALTVACKKAKCSSSEAVLPRDLGIPVELPMRIGHQANGTCPTHFKITLDESP